MLRNDLYTPWFLEDKKWGFEIVSGDFQGVVVEIEKLNFSEDVEGKLDVEYHVINKPDIINEEDIKGEMFEAAFELIINDIVREAIETLDEKDRNGNTSEPN